jgi:two-component system chemotaxis response regulator CheB
VLVVDDTAVFRRVVSDALGSLPGVEVVGTAIDGRAALARIRELEPDLVTLDIEMPEMDGVQVLQALREQGTEVGVLVLSALTQKGGELTMKALELGAFDFITKPTGGGPDRNREWLAAELGPRLKAFDRRWEVQKMLRKGQGVPAAASRPPAPSKAPGGGSARPLPANPVVSRPEVVVIGVSTGGPAALSVLLPMLPANLPVPVLIVQHMPPLFTRSLAASLDARSQLKVKEASDGEPFLPGTVYIAPGGFHLKLQVDADGRKSARILDEPPENHCKPSVDVLFRSVAHALPGRAAGVILTGMGNDGTLGLRLLKRHGAIVIAQDEASCVVFGMPKEAIHAGVVDVVAPLQDIAAEIQKALRVATP